MNTSLKYLDNEEKLIYRTIENRCDIAAQIVKHNMDLLKFGRILRIQPRVI